VAEPSSVPCAALIAKDQIRHGSRGRMVKIDHIRWTFRGSFVAEVSPPARIRLDPKNMQRERVLLSPHLIESHDAKRFYCSLCQKPLGVGSTLSISISFMRHVEEVHGPNPIPPVKVRDHSR